MLGVWGLLAFLECPDPQILGPKLSLMKGLGEKCRGREQYPQCSDTQTHTHLGHTLVSRPLRSWGQWSPHLPSRLDQLESTGARRH